MATKKKTKLPEAEVIQETTEAVETVETVEAVETPEIPVVETVDEAVVTEAPVVEEKIEEKVEEKVEESMQDPYTTPKYAVGSIVFVSKDADADLNGFKLFPPYKKYTYTVEAYDADTGIYSLRRLNLSLKLKEALIVAPSERAHDSLNRKQF